MGRGNIAYEQSHGGYTVRAWYGQAPGDRAHIEIICDDGGHMIREFPYEAYRIWNIAAHFPEIVAELRPSEGRAG